jgi:sugar-specific transcriptional regulator TrmB
VAEEVSETTKEMIAAAEETSEMMIETIADHASPSIARAAKDAVDSAIKDAILRNQETKRHTL